MLTIKSYVNDDWEGMRKLIMEMWDEEYSYNAVNYKLLDPFYYQHNFLKDDHHIFIARDDQGVCGYIVLSKNDKALEIVIVCVARRKRRQGVSLALFKQTEEYGKLEGYKEIVVYSINANTRSHKLKAKLGYKNTTTAYTSVKKL